MKENVVIIITDDDEGHVSLIKRNLKDAGITNKIIYFKGGQETLDFLFKRGKGPHIESGTSYILLLDLRMPEVEGTEVLRQIKSNRELRKIPVVIITTTDDPKEVDCCYNLGCSFYVVKPVDYDKFSANIKQLGMFLMVMEVPKVQLQK